MTGGERVEGGVISFAAADRTASLRAACSSKRSKWTVCASIWVWEQCDKIAHLDGGRLMKVDVGIGARASPETTLVVHGRWVSLHSSQRLFH